MYRLFVIAFAVAMVALAGVMADTSHADSEGARFAFIVGNGDRRGGTADPIGRNAQAMSNVLEAAGYGITLLENAREVKMRRMFQAFLEALPEGAQVIVYYGGRGGIINGRLILFPVDVNPLGLPPSIDISEWMSALAKHKPRGALWLIDANFPLQAERYTLRLQVPNHMIVGFACLFHRPPEQVGLFGASLVDGIRSGASGIDELLDGTRSRVFQQSHGKQISWEISNAAPGIWSDAFSPTQDRTSAD